jgi:hypothetical protein
MEMDLAKLDAEALSDGEKAFIAALASMTVVGYGAGYLAEQATLGLLAKHFRHLNQFANVTLLRVGSGGRFEGAGLGDTELCLLTKDSMREDLPQPTENQSELRIYPASHFDTLAETTGTDIIGVGLTEYMNVSLEHKRLDGTEQLSYYAGNETPYPGRILEGEYLAGNQSLITEARRKVFSEIATDHTIIKRLKKDLRVHKKVCDTGVSRKVRQFDLDADEFYFNPPQGQFGMKYGLLRYAQAAISLEFFELFQRKQFPVEEYIDLSQSVEERIRYAFRKGWVANEKHLINLGRIYVQVANMNTIAKINFFTDDSNTTTKCPRGELRRLHEQLDNSLKRRLFID